MKIDELISELEEVKEEHGNLEVFIPGNGSIDSDRIKAEEGFLSIQGDDPYQH